MKTVSRTTRHAPRAFTLIEVLLALLLSSALLAGLWAALEVSLRMFESGRTRVEEAQLTRALLNQLDADLQQTSLQSSLPPQGEVLALIPAPSSGGTPSSLTNGSSSSSFSNTAPKQPSVAGILPLSRGAGPVRPLGAGMLQGRHAASSKVRRAGLSGSAHELRLDLCRVLPAQAAVARHRELVAAETLELRTVFYALARPLPAEQAALGAPTYSGDALIRYETSWLDSPGESSIAQPAGLQTSGQDQMFEEFLAIEDRYEATQRDTHGAELPEMPSEDFAVAPEVAGLEFRYYDGVDWLSSWDSEADGRLPVAVEIVAAIRPVLSQRAARAQAAALEERPDEQPQYPISRLVVQLPLGGGNKAEAATFGESTDSVSPTSNDPSTGGIPPTGSLPPTGYDPPASSNRRRLARPPIGALKSEP